MSLKSQLNKTCTLRRFSTSGTDNYNRPVETWADLATNVACMLQPQKVGNKEILNEIQEVVVSTQVLFLDFDATNSGLTNVDRVIVETVEYEILVVRNPAGRDHHLELDLRRIGS